MYYSVRRSVPQTEGSSILSATPGLCVLSTEGVGTGHPLFSILSWSLFRGEVRRYYPTKLRTVKTFRQVSVGGTVLLVDPENDFVPAESFCRGT